MSLMGVIQRDTRCSAHRRAAAASSRFSGDGSSGTGQAVAVDEALGEEVLHHRRHSADLVQVLHHVPAAGLEVGDEGDPIAHRLEVVDGEVHVHRAGHRDEVQHRVGGPSERHDHHHCVLERGAGHDVARLDVLLHQRAHRGARPPALLELGRIHGRGGRAVRAATCPWPRSRWPWCWRCTCRRRRPDRGRRCARSRPVRPRRCCPRGTGRSSGRR